VVQAQGEKGEGGGAWCRRRVRTHNCLQVFTLCERKGQHCTQAPQQSIRKQVRTNAEKQSS
jgi:hypothetical protein